MLNPDTLPVAPAIVVAGFLWLMVVIKWMQR